MAAKPIRGVDIRFEILARSREFEGRVSYRLAVSFVDVSPLPCMRSPDDRNEVLYIDSLWTMGYLSDCCVSMAKLRYTEAEVAGSVDSWLFFGTALGRRPYRDLKVGQCLPAPEFQGLLEEDEPNDGS